MPELPDITVYIEALERELDGAVLTRIELPSPFVLRTAVPPIAALEGRRLGRFRRIGKRIAFGFEDELWLGAVDLSSTSLLRPGLWAGQAEEACCSTATGATDNAAGRNSGLSPAGCA